MKKSTGKALLLVTGLYMLLYTHILLNNKKESVNEVYHNVTGVVTRVMDLPSSKRTLVELVEPEGLFPARNFVLRNITREGYSALSDLGLERGDTLDLKVPQNLFSGNRIIYVPGVELSKRYNNK